MDGDTYEVKTSELIGARSTLSFDEISGMINDGGQDRLNGRISTLKLTFQIIIGSLKGDDFLDKLAPFKSVFEYKEMSHENKVKLPMKLKGRASTWWDQIKAIQERWGKSKVGSREKMKSLVRGTF